MKIVEARIWSLCTSSFREGFFFYKTKSEWTIVYSILRLLKLFGIKQNEVKKKDEQMPKTKSDRNN